MKTVVLFLIFFFSSIVIAQNAVQPLGSGTVDDPYLISSLDNLYWITSNPSSWDKYFEQTADIDASATSSWDGGQGWKPIGDVFSGFDGKYDGQNYSISGLFINRVSTDCIGLFGVSSGAYISNLKLLNENISGKDYTGGIVGKSTGDQDSYIRNCSVNGTVSGVNYTGGLVGEGNQSIRVDECRSDVNVNGNNSIGAFIGSLLGGQIYNSYCFGSVTRNSGSTLTDVGSFCGLCVDGKIEKSYSVADVNYQDAEDPIDKGFVGGESGSNTYTNNFFDSEVSNQNTATGATGKTTNQMQTKTTFSLAGWDFAITWDMNPAVNNGEPVLQWQGYGEGAVEPTLGDGTLGNPWQIENLQNLYWIAESSSRWHDNYIQTADIDASETSTWFDGNGWPPIGGGTTPLTSFAGTYNGQSHSIDGLTIDRGSTNYVGLFGSTYEAEISNLDLTNSDITGHRFTAVVIGYNTRSDLSWITTSGDIIGAEIYTGGLVGNNTTNSNINNCSSGGTVTGNNNTGGLVGNNESECVIDGSNSTCTVSGNYYVGGLAGTNQINSTITNCSSTGTVTGTGNYVGGFVGDLHSNSNITKSYSKSSVYGNGDSHGGLFGIAYDNSTISNSYYSGGLTRTSGTDETFGAFGGWSDATTIGSCYSTGSVFYDGSANPTDKGFLGGYGNANTYSDNFFDNEASNQTSGTGATAKNTAEMKTQSTFLDAGWSSSIWYMDAGFNSGYPYLEWQNPSGTPLPVELTSFEGDNTEDGVVLNWQTATEVNNYGFQVQRRKKNKKSNEHNAEWEVLGFIEGHGNSNSTKDYSFMDKASLYETTQYRLKQIDFDGMFKYSDVLEVKIGLPIKYELSQNYPNPFNPSTTLYFTILDHGMVKINVYNILGEVVTELVNENLDAGFHQLQFSASNLTSGIYFYSISVNGFTQVKKMNLIK
ncbi:MAG: T9SS type A sorting domain-containing protein [Bacteroidetes bacterium]|nr:T9SS type A sorting domain-containing protein [Bacteroidota bacterium]MBU1113913.1 T9SS type A sorting domain-containing protein [Bacteroidota bacterium]MBU1798232.1 T9SS type A sorting domain-containing protein [Bacteroidota bacterium]